jgi:hypothetical protein
MNYDDVEHTGPVCSDGFFIVPHGAQVLPGETGQWEIWEVYTEEEAVRLRK